jgi:hypothetical protein
MIVISKFQPLDCIEDLEDKQKVFERKNGPFIDVKFDDLKH